MADGLAAAIRDEISRILAPLSAAADRTTGSTLLVRAVGHAAGLGGDPGLRAELDRIAQLARDIGDLSDDDLASWAGLARILDLARDVMSAVQIVESTVEDPVLAARAQRLGAELAERLLSTYLRTHRPRLFRVAAALTLVTPAERADPEPMVLDGTNVTRLPWARDRLHPDRLSLLVSDPLDALRPAYLPGAMQVHEHAHTAAAHLFPLLGELATALNLSWFVDHVRATPEIPSPPPGDDNSGGGEPFPPDDDPDEGLPPSDPPDLTAFYRDYRPRWGLQFPRLVDGTPQPPRFGLAVVASSAQHPGGLRGYVLTPVGEFNWTETRGQWRVEAAAEGAVPAFTVGPDGVRVVDVPAQTEVQATLAAERIAAPGTPAFVLGGSGGTRVEVGALRFVAGADISPARQALSVSAEAASAVLVLVAEDEDGFLRAVLPDDGVRVPFNLGVVLSSDRGLEWRAGAGLAVTLPVQHAVGPVAIRQIRLELRAGGGATALDLTGTFDVRLGPLTVTVEGLGMRLRASAPADGGNLGPLDLDAGFRWPSGAGIAVNAGPISGSGFAAYDEDTGSYSGALALRLQRMAIQAAALLNTRLPAGQPGFSLLVMLSARFFPGIQLGFGITLTGVGGLLGVNRRIDVDALQQRFAAGTAASILNPPDPGRAISTQLTELAAVFPPADGVVVIGPTVQLQWAGLVTVDAGVFIELPGPSKVVLLGTARAVITNPLARGPLLQLRADFLGVIDIDKRTIAFDAVLVDSHLLEVFAITGGMSLRADLGEADPYLILTVGGFHPDFTPPRLAFPSTLTRLAMSSGSPGDRLYLRFEGYFAITPNTMQFGAAVEVSAKLGPLRVKGSLGFDALVRFQPFYFTIDFRASLRVTVKGRNLAGVKVTGTISGPGPVVFSGKACISILFFDICGKATFELGSKAPPQVSPAPSAFEVLTAELRNPANLRAAGPDAQVVLRKLPAGTAVLPHTGLIWQQARAPLGLLLERLEGVPLRQAETVTASSAHSSGDEREWFAPGSFADLSDAEALNRRTFERLPAGLRLATGDDVASAELVHLVMVEDILIPAPPVPPDRRPGTTLPPWLLDSVAVREDRPVGRLAAPLVRVADESWEVRNRTGQVLAQAVGEAQAHQLARTVAHAVATVSGDTVVLPNL